MSTTVNGTTQASSSSSASSSAASGSATGSTGDALTQADFLKLLTTQLQAQDPTNPVDNTQFASELAQFSQLSATQQLDTDLQTLGSNVQTSLQSSQVLSSSNLVGRDVLVPGSKATYDGDAVGGAVNVTSAGDVTVTVSDASGQVVRTIDLGQQSSGLSKFSWDGKDDQGNAVENGSYTLAASVGGTSQDTYLSGKVDSVGYGGSDIGTYLQVDGIGGVPLNQVAQIY